MLVLPVLWLLLISLGVGACHPDEPKRPVKPNDTTSLVDPTEVTLTPIAVTLQVGETQQLTVVVKPLDRDFAVTFTSDKPEVALVDDKGVVTAVAEGKAQITVCVGKLTRECAVTVVRKKDPVLSNELPLLKFEAKQDDSEILAYEKKLGRKAQNISVGGVSLSGFVNKSLLIVGAIYDVREKSDLVILGLSRESLDACDKTKEMAQTYYGFGSFDSGKFADGKPYLSAKKTDDPSITLRMYDQPNQELGTRMLLEFRKEQPLLKEHDLISTARDFPNYKAFVTKDVSRIKAFEEQLDLRAYQADPSDEKKVNLIFMTKADCIDKTNFVFVCYFSTLSGGVPFINSVLNFISTKEDFNNPEIKNWLARNGYPKEYKADVSNGYISAYDETGTVKCQLYIGQGAAMLQIFKADTPESIVQLYYNLGRKQLALMGLWTSQRLDADHRGR